MIYLVALSFLVGLLTRIVDLKEDNGLALPRFSEIVLGLLYGVIISFVFTAWPETGVLLGVFIALILTKKIDATGHFAGLLGLAAAFFYWGIPELRLAMVLFILIGALDEAVDWLQEKRFHGLLAKVLYIRPFTEIAAFAYSLATGFWEVWFVMISFDVAFVVFDRIGKKTLKK